MVGVLADFSIELKLFRTGKRLLGGDELTPMERHFAGVGTILGMLPAGGTILCRIGDFVQEVRQLKSVAKFGLAGREVVAADEAADGVQGIFNSAKEIGWGAGDLKRFAKSVSDVSRHGPMSAGRMHEIPLGNVTLADTFRSSSYFSYKNTEPFLPSHSPFHSRQGCVQSKGWSLCAASWERLWI